MMVSKKRRKPDSFKRSLAEANIKLALALKQRIAAQKALSLLNAEIPALQRTIAALQQQVNPKGVMPNEKITTAVTGDRPSGERVDAGLKPYVMPDIDESMGSIPAVAGETVKELTEDELLAIPDDGGEQII